MTNKVNEHIPIINRENIEDKSTISAITNYSSKIVCAVEKENLFGTQFHPEKSDKFGLIMIDNFLKL